MRTQLVPLGFLPLFLLPAPAVAQQVRLPDIVLTANRALSEAQRTGATVSVLTAEDFAVEGRPFVLDQITELPGVSVQQSGPPGTVSGFSLRGVPQRYVRLHVDGIEVSDPTGPQVTPSLSNLLIDDVARIEVLKGSQSALYGGQAVGGVIAITTPAAVSDGLSTRYRLEGGSFGTTRGSLTLAGRAERAEGAFTLARYATDGFSAAEEADGNDEDDGFETTRLSARGTVFATETVALFGSAFYQTEDGDFDAGPGPGGDAANTFEADSWGLRGGVDVLAFGVENRFALSRYAIDRTQVSEFGPFVTDGTRTSAEYLGRYRVSDAVGLQFGTDYTRETSESNFSDGEAANEVIGLFAQSDWFPTEALTLNTAIRRDEHSEFGGFTTGRLTAAYALSAGTTVRASLGSGFRAPSNFELFDAFSGNPGLDPETSRSADIGVAQTFAGGRGLAGATLFWIEIEDLIEFDPDTFVFFQTGDSATSRGLEFSAAWSLSDRLTLTSAYTYTEAEDAAGIRRNRIPRHDLDVTLDAALTERLGLGVGVQYVADYVDTTGPADTRAFDADFLLVNARLAYAVTDDAEIYLRAANLTDAQYQTARGFSTADRALYLGVAGRF